MSIELAYVYYVYIGYVYFMVSVCLLDKISFTFFEDISSRVNARFESPPTYLLHSAIVIEG